MPDIFVPQDTTGFNAYYSALSRSGLFRSYTFNYTDKNRSTLSQYSDMPSLLAYLKSSSVLEGFYNEATRKGVRTPSAEERNEAARNVETVVYGNIIYNMLGMDEYIQFLNRTDPVVLRAVEVLEQGTSVPLS